MRALQDGHRHERVRGALRATISASPTAAPAASTSTRARSSRAARRSATGTPVDRERADGDGGGHELVRRRPVPVPGRGGQLHGQHSGPTRSAISLAIPVPAGGCSPRNLHYDLLNGNGKLPAPRRGTTAARSATTTATRRTTPTRHVVRGRLDAQRPGTFRPVYGGTSVILVGVLRNNISAVTSPAQRWLYTAVPATCSSTARRAPGCCTCRSGSCTGGYCNGCLPDGNGCTSNGQCCNNNCAGGGNKACGGSTPPTGIPIHYTFDTPFNQSPSCGRVVYSDFHVESQQTSADYSTFTFPNECPGGATGAMTTQEKLLEFMIFDLTSCVSAPSCTPLTCAAFPGKCGVQGDGCGGQTANCGTCTLPATCGGGGTASVCGYPDGASCAPLTCASFPGKCGVQGDGCGGQTANCNPCTAPATCGGGGVAGQCGYPDAGCTPRTCASFPSTTCGEQSDGCGGHTANCNPCTPPATCGGGGGRATKCGHPMTRGATLATCSCSRRSSAATAPTAAAASPPAIRRARPAAAASATTARCPSTEGACSRKSCEQQLPSSARPDRTTAAKGSCLRARPAPAGRRACSTSASRRTAARTPSRARSPPTTCGEQGDGCGGHTELHPCTPPATCGGGGGVPDEWRLPTAVHAPHGARASPGYVRATGGLRGGVTAFQETQGTATRFR